MSGSATATLEAVDAQLHVYDPSGAYVVAEPTTTVVWAVDSGPEHDFLVLGTATDGPIRVTVETCEVVSADVSTEWTEVVEFSVRCATGLVVADSDHDRELALSTVGGPVRIRVSTRTLPRERLLLQVWPAPMSPEMIVRTSATDSVTAIGWTERMALPRERLGIAAGERIGVDLDGRPGCRVLTGRTSDLRVAHAYTMTRRKLFTPMKLMFWFTAGSGRPALVGELDSEGDRCTVTMGRHKGGNPAFYDPFLGADPSTEIRAVRTSFDRPSRVSFTWEWVRRTDDPFEESEPLTPRSAVDIVLDEKKTASGVVTTARVLHEGLPVEWVDDMRRVWAWKLEQLAHNLS